MAIQFYVKFQFCESLVANDEDKNPYLGYTACSSIQIML